ncbi:MAG: SDR family NAD(P)-dependent oxidoreductase [Myxococcota bacterium]|nr:SDR family NAD(P)-dependent oxidoreductase [Myxococcota bacterium]
MSTKIPNGARSVITGAGSGFGRAMALDLAARGARLLLSDISSTSLEETCALARAKGAETSSMIVDVRDAGQVEAMAARAEELWGGTDVLANNAGVAVAGAVGEIPLEDWKWQIDINLMGVIHGCHFFVPKMKAQNRGWILNVASIAGIVSAPMMGPYNVTKAGVIALSETLATELAPQNIRVTALCPSFFRTNIHQGSRSTGDLGSRTEKLVTEARWSAEEIAAIAIRGLECGELYVMPQPDAKVMWRAKRALGSRFFGAIGAAAKGGYLERFFGGDAKAH